MSVQSKVIEALRAMIDALNPFAPITVGPLTEGEGLTLSVSAGRTETVTLSLGGTAALDVALACRRADQTAAMETLCQIHEALTKSEALPGGEGWQTIAVDTASSPACVNREGPYWVYGSALSVRYTAD